MTTREKDRGGAPPCAAPTRWLLLRHGQTEANQGRLLAGDEESPLTYGGRWQAITAGLALRGQPTPRLLCSDLSRARQTAAALASAAGWHDATWLSSPALRERSVGAWRGLPYQQARATGRLIQWDDAPPGGESLRDVALRVLAFLAPLPEQDTLLVAHAGPIRVLFGLLCGVAPERIGTLKVPNATPIAVEVAPGALAELARAVRTPTSS
ncbi:MAG: histidine phosphatase family protein [Pseudomonadota bacterium]